MENLFPSFVAKEYNLRLVEDMSKEGLLEALHSFKKDKSPGLDDWTIELFLGFYEIIEDDIMKVIKESRVSSIYRTHP